MKTVLIAWTAALLVAAVCIVNLDLPTINSASHALAALEH